MAQQMRCNIQERKIDAEYVYVTQLEKESCCFAGLENETPVDSVSWEDNRVLLLVTFKLAFVRHPLQEGSNFDWSRTGKKEERADIDQRASSWCQTDKIFKSITPEERVSYETHRG